MICDRSFYPAVKSPKECWMMTKIKRISILMLAFALLILSNARAQQNSSGPSGIKARGRGSKLVLTSQGKRHVLDVSHNIDAAKLDDVSVLFATRRQDFLYLLVSACG